MPVTNFELKKNYSHVRALNGHVNPSCVDTRPDHVNTWLATSTRPRPRASPVEHRPRLCHCGLLPIADPQAHPCYDGFPAATIATIHAPATATTRTSPTASTTPTRAADHPHPTWIRPPQPCGDCHPHQCSS